MPCRVHPEASAPDGELVGKILKYAGWKHYRIRKATIECAECADYFVNEGPENRKYKYWVSRHASLLE